MINPVANMIVVIVFGLMIGASWRLGVAFQGARLEVNIPPRRRQQSSDGTNESSREWRERVKEAIKEAEARQGAPLMPRSAKFAMLALFGLTLILVLIAIVGPVDMRWWPFLVSLFLSFFLTGWLFARAKAGKLRPPDASNRRPLLR